jgi:hypothetical protein
MTPLSRTGRRIVTGAGVLLTLFHVWLFGSQAWAGQLDDPQRLVRWAVAALLIAALVLLRRSQPASAIGRRAVAIWLTAGLLHVPAASQRLAGVNLPPVPDAMVALTPLAASVFAAGAALLAAWRAARWRSPRPVRIVWIARPVRRVRSLDRPVRRRFAPRPPPLLPLRLPS